MDRKCPFAALQHDRMVCRFDDMTGKHTIVGQPCTFDLQGALYKRVNLDNSDLIVSIESYDRNTVTVTKPLPKAEEAILLGWRELIASGVGGFLDTFKLLLDESRKICAVLGLYPRPASFFDICIPQTLAGRGSVQFLRPVYYTDNALCFYRELNETFLRLCREASALQMQRPRATSPTAATPLPPPALPECWSMLRRKNPQGRNQKVCHLDLLKRRPPEALRCGGAGRVSSIRAGLKAAEGATMAKVRWCSHEARCEDAVRAIQAGQQVPERTVCVNTIDRVLVELGEEHECRLMFEGSRDFFAVLLGRTDLMHTVLCYPEVLMNGVWLEDFERLLNRLISRCCDNGWQT